MIGQEGGPSLEPRPDLQDTGVQGRSPGKQVPDAMAGPCRGSEPGKTQVWVFLSARVPHEQYVLCSSMVKCGGCAGAASL